MSIADELSPELAALPPPAGYQVLRDPVHDIVWEIQPMRWRGGTVNARWANPKDVDDDGVAGEHIVKADGTDVYARAGDVVILDNKNEPKYSVSRHLAALSYNLTPLPKDRTDVTPHTLERRPEPVLTLEITQPTTFRSVFPEDFGKWRTLEPGDVLEYAAHAKEAALRPVRKDSIPTRYIPETEAFRINTAMAAKGSSLG